MLTLWNLQEFCVIAFFIYIEKRGAGQSIQVTSQHWIAQENIFKPIYFPFGITFHATLDIKLFLKFRGKIFIFPSGDTQEFSKNLNHMEVMKAVFVETRVSAEIKYFEFRESSSLPLRNFKLLEIFERALFSFKSPAL